MKNVLDTAKGSERMRHDQSILEAELTQAVASAFEALTIAEKVAFFEGYKDSQESQLLAA